MAPAKLSPGPIDSAFANLSGVSSSDMSQRIWIIAIVAYLFCGISITRTAAGTGRYTVDVWPTPTDEDLRKTDENLLDNSLIALTQTRDGYLWLGTFSGNLVRFDGIRFTTFNEGNTPGLATSPIVYLFEDSHTNLWLGTRAGGIAFIQNGRVIPQPIGGNGRESRLVAACEDAEGAVWLYRADGQLFRYREGKIDVCRIPTLSEPSAHRTLIAEQSGMVWVGNDTRMFGINPKTGSDAALPLEQVLNVTNGLDLLVASKQGGYWRLAGGEIEKWTGNNLAHSFGPYPWDRRLTRIYCAAEDRNGNLLVGTSREGVWLFNAEGKTAPISISSHDGLSHDTILSLCVDREGSYWAGTDGGGLDRIKRQVFDVVSESRDKTVQSVCEDAQGGIYFGILEGGLSRLKDGVVQKIGADQAATNLAVRAVYPDHQSNIWVGADNAGLFQIQNDQFVRPPGYQPVPYINAIHEDRNQRLWLGTPRGLVRWAGSDSQIFTNQNPSASDMVRAIADDAQGNLWVGTDSGLSFLQEGQFHFFHKKDGLPSEHISALWVDSEDVLWIGTPSGLARLDRGKWTTYTTRQGLGSDNIDYLIEDGQENLWIGSNAGLMRVPKSALNAVAQGLTNFVPCRAYGTADGLPTRECTQNSQPAAWRARDGTLWFATIRGLVYVHPGGIRQNTNPPPVVIESVLVDGQSDNTNALRTSLTSAVTVPAGRERVDIQYTSLNLTAAKKARFKYRMEGFETAWTDAQDSRIAHYPQLRPGHYTFRVKACNEDSVWNETGASLAFIVEPPFWQTWWFISLAVLCVVGIVAGVVHYLSTQRLERQLAGLRQQQALEKERARIARDIHDQLGASLTQVSLLGEMVESDKDFPEEVEAHAKQISQTARDTSRALDEIVWTVNPSNDTLEGLINYICKYAQEYFAVAGLRYRLDVPAQLPSHDISPEMRHNVFLAAKEAVTNVVRHAKATEVWLRLHLDDESFTLELQDNGRGPVGLEGKQSRNGLRNMHKRMEDIGGTFELKAAPEGGALVRLNVPLGNR